MVEALDAVIEWHERGLVPLGPQLTGGSAAAASCGGTSLPWPPTPARRFRSLPAPAGEFHAVLLDIDHSPRHLLHARHGAFYQPAGLRLLGAQLHPRGVFALWSDDPPDAAFLATLRGVFATAEGHVVSFFNPLLERDSASTVYVARGV